MLNGVFAVRKAAGWTSADVVRKLKGTLVTHLRATAAEEAAEVHVSVAASDDGSGGRGKGHERSGGKRGRRARVKVKIGHGGTVGSSFPDAPALRAGIHVSSLARAVREMSTA